MQGISRTGTGALVDFHVMIRLVLGQKCTVAFKCDWYWAAVYCIVSIGRVLGQ